MPGTEIKVIAYSGYRNDETPRAIVLHDRRIEVVEILKRWIEKDLKDPSLKRFFQVKGNDGSIHTLYYDEGSGRWFLQAPLRE